MATYVRARASTENILAGGRQRDVADRVQYLDPDSDPFCTVVKKLNKKIVATDPKFEWIEKGLAEKFDAVNGAITTGTTALVVDNPTRWNVGDVGHELNSGEKFLVTAVVTGTSTLTIVRSVGATVAATMTDNDDLLIIGNAQPEGGALPLEKTHQETQPYNYIQIFRHAFGLTGTAAATKGYAGHTLADIRREKAVEHKIDIEQAFIKGERDIFTTGSDTTNQPRRFMGGILNYATSNITASVGTLTEAELETWLQSVFAHTSSGNTRLLLASPLVISTLDQIAAGRLQTTSRDNTYGIAIRNWTTGHGDLMIVKHRLLDNGPTTGQGYGGYAIAIDPTKMSYVTMAGRDTKLQVDIGTPGDDGQTDAYLSDASLMFANPENAGVLKGITG